MRISPNWGVSFGGLPIIKTAVEFRGSIFGSPYCEKLPYEVEVGQGCL